MATKSKPRKTLVEEALAPPRDNLNDLEVGQAIEEALDPGATTQTVAIGGAAVPITFLTYGFERRMIRLIAPYLRLLTDASMMGAFDAVLGAVLVEAEADLARLACIILEPHRELLGPLPKVPPPLKGQVRTDAQELALRLEAWLDQRARFGEIVELVLAQIEKNRLATELGKLWAPGALGVGLLKALNTLPAQLMQALQLSPTASPPGMASSLPSA